MTSVFTATATWQVPRDRRTLWQRLRDARNAFRRRHPAVTFELIGGKGGQDSAL